jgi:ubiquinone/menaquinone biosynthesis C-methylase UbiE
MVLQEMEFTGERFVPQLSGEIKYEHLHRYALCLKLSKNKVVLDIASGEGYGAFILSKEAKTVIGVDIDRESIKHAQHKYHHIENLKFLLGDCTAIPLPDNSVDLVTSFETIEHHDKHEEMILEIKRVLKEEGQLIISSPNRLVYSDEPNYSNPYHVKELYYEEFVSLLSRHFNEINIYGQKLASASFVSSLKTSNARNYTAYTGEIDDLAEKTCSLKSSIYFLAICSDETQTSDFSIESVYIDADNDLLGLLQDDRKRAQIQLKKYELELEQSQSQLHLTRSELEQSQSQLHLTRSELEQSQSQLHLTRSELEQSQSQLHLTLSELEQSQSQLHLTLSELEQSQLHLTRSELEQSQLHLTRSELEQSQSQLHLTRSELEQSQSQLHLTLSELEQSQSQLHLTLSELEQSQSQLHLTRSELEQSQSQLHLTRSELEQSQSKFQLFYQQLENALRQVYLAQNGWERSLRIVTAMESSKFWKLRQAWFKIKSICGINNS